MTLSDKDREKLLDYLSTLPDDELAGFVDEASQSARFNPDVREKQMIGLQYARGTRGGREIYDRDKAAAEKSLSEIGSFVAAEKAKRAEKYKTDKIEPNREANKKGIFGIQDDADEDSLSLEEVVEKRVKEQNTIAASDDSQLQRELDGINPEAMQVARADRDRASQKSDERKARNDRASLARLDREAEAGFAQADQGLADADAARMREGEEAFAAESDRQRSYADALTRLDREAEAGFAQAEEMIAEDQAALTDRDRASQMSEERRARNERATEQGQDLQEEAMSLFPKIMGSSFNPKSSMDKGKLEVIMKAKRENPDLSPNQLALTIYKNYM